MEFSLSDNGQSSALEHWAKKVLYKGLYEETQKSACSKVGIRFSSLFVGITSSVLTLAKRIGRIVESLFKGVLNFLGGFCCGEKSSLLTGLRQIFLDTPWQLCVRLPISILSAVWGIFAKTVAILVFPTEYTYERWCAHDSAETARKKAADDAAEFNTAFLSVELNPDDAEQVKILADHYLEGRGTPINRDRAIELYTQAAGRGHMKSIKKMVGIAKELGSLEAWLNFTGAAALQGDNQSLRNMGLISYGTRQYEEAAQFFRTATGKGDKISQACLVHILELEYAPASYVGEAAHLKIGCTLMEQSDANLALIGCGTENKWKEYSI